MQSVGQVLHDERIRRGITLEAIAAQTRISLKNLEAIEADDVSQTGSAFFYKSFVKQFAEALSFNYALVASDVNATADSLPAPLIPGQAEPSLHVPPIRPRRQFSLRSVVPVLWLAGVLVACSTLYAIWGKAHPRNMDLKPAASPVVLARSAMPAKPAAPPPKPAAVVQDAAAGFMVKISAIERTWLSIDADGRHIYSGILEPSASRTLEGHQSARVLAGNAGGVTVVFNGREIGPLGGRGQVRTIVFTRGAYEIVGAPAESRVDLSHIASISE